MMKMHNIHQTRHSHYRADIDGLRALAILLVICGHVYEPIMPAGFIGVDIFFLISGFVITRIILRDMAADQFHFLGFLARRVRRLFPALIVMLIATSLAGFFLLLPYELGELGKQVLATALYGNNILNYFQAGYFDAEALSKPLLHTWSLGVEEQYYLFFPLLLLLVYRAKLFIPLALLAIALLSFLTNLHLSYNDIAAAFYLPMARLWEFLVGGIIAYYDINKKAPTSTQRYWLHNIGALLGGLCISIAAVKTNSASFPGWWVLLPVMGTALVILSPNSFLNRYILSSNIAVFIGLVSYALYLWHWPILVFLNQYGNFTHAGLAILVITSSLILAILTYRWVEVPILTNTISAHQKRTTYVLLMVMACIAATGAYSVQQKGFLVGYHKDIQNVLATESADLPKRKDSVVDAHGPYLLLTGDSHADHLYEGLVAHKQQLATDVVLHHWHSCSAVRWSFNALCQEQFGQYTEELKLKAPDTVIISAYWGMFAPVDGIEHYIKHLKKKGAENIIIIGELPTWRQRLPIVIYNEYIQNPENGPPARLFPPEKARDTAAKRHLVNAKLKQIAQKHQLLFIDPTDYLCNSDGCEVILANQKAIQYDSSHLTAEGSIYLISKIIDKIAPRAP